MPFAVVVRFKGVGNAPIMRQNVYKIIATNRFQAVIQFLRKELGWQKGEPLVCSSVVITLNKSNNINSSCTSTLHSLLLQTIRC